MEQTILERLVSYVYVCVERFLGFPKLTALLVTFRLYLLACFKKNRYILLSPGFIRNLDTATIAYIPKQQQQKNNNNNDRNKGTNLRLGLTNYSDL